MFDWFDRLFLAFVMFGLSYLTTGWISYALLFSAYLVFVFNALMLIGASVLFYKTFKAKLADSMSKTDTPDEMISKFKKQQKKTR